jgi:hypothetical protein
MTTTLTIPIPVWADLIFVAPLLVYRYLKFGIAFRKILLTQGLFAIVSVRDYYVVSKFKWNLVKSKNKRYAVCSVYDDAKGKNINVYMHRFIMNPPDGMKVDHRNSDGLNNHRDNLRIATRIQNCWNRQKQAKAATSKFKGVSYLKKDKKWRARIRFNNQIKYLGLFTDEIEAAKAYDEAAGLYHGEFARLNFE